MPFGLNNAGATYQRVMTYIFEDLLDDAAECYVDDLVIKTKLKQHYITDLDWVFQQLHCYNLKMNHLKCVFSVLSRQFLGFIIWRKGIEINPKKIIAIVEMPTPQNITELKRLQGRLTYIRRFISNLSRCCQPFSCLMKKGVSFVWD